MSAHLNQGKICESSLGSTVCVAIFLTETLDYKQLICNSNYFSLTIVTVVFGANDVIIS